MSRPRIKIAFVAKSNSFVRARGILFSVALAISSPHAWAGASIITFGYIDTYLGSVAKDVSSDGSVVVGNIGRDAFRWDVTSGIVLFKPMAPSLYTAMSATDVSADGQVIIGYEYDVSGSRRSVRWTAQTGFTYLSPSIYPEGMSADGRVIVGSDYLGNAVRGTAEEGFVGLGGLPGGVYGQALATSADGSVIVGADYIHAQLAEEAFRWTVETGMVSLGMLPGTYKSTAYDVSADGSVVVGDSHVEAFRWTAQEGMVGLGLLPGGQQSGATAVSANGGVIVGDAGLDGRVTAFRWTAKGGIRDLQQIFSKAYGLDLGGWGSFHVNAISADGNTMVGYGRNSLGYQEGWRVRIDPDQPAVGGVLVEGAAGTKIPWAPSVFDPEDDTLTCRIDQTPVNGVASLASDCSSGTYQSHPGFIGIDSFTYITNDGINDSNPGTVAVAVTEPQGDPVCLKQYPVSPFSQTGKEGTLTITFTGHITSRTNKVVRLCPGTILKYQASSTQGPVVCKVKHNTTRGSGSLKINDHIKCTDKPAGKDKVHFKVKSGVR